MAKKVAPSKVTSGGGFNFEEKVIGYYSVFLLNEHIPFRKDDGYIEKIDMQVRVDGWFLDDMLVTLKNPNGIKRICFSIKSNQQFVGCKSPADFVELAWEQFLEGDKVKFDKAKDGIGLIVSKLSNDVHLAVQDILNYSRTMASNTVPSRLKEENFTNDCVRELFNSFRCPEKLAKKYSITDNDIGELLKIIYIIEFDFEETISRRHNEAVKTLTNSLKSNSKDEAELLWYKLIGIVTETKRAGYIDNNVLLTKLAGKFQLLEYPSHKNDWDILKNHTIENIELINDKIGSDTIGRDDDVKKLNEAISQNKLTFLTGESGTGKTVLAKQWSLSRIERDETVVWLDAEYLNRGLLTDFQNSLGLSHNLSEILDKSTDANPVLIIDKLDRVYEDHAYRNISIILNKLLPESSGSRWHFLILVQSDELNRVISKLLNNNLLLPNYKNHEIENPTFTQYKDVLEKHTEIYKLIIRNKSNNLLLKPKILDIIAQNASILKDINKNDSIGESEIIDWIWDNYIRKGDNSEERASFVMKLAEKQALTRKTQIPKVEFTIPEQSPLNSLVRDKICVVKDEKISFTHNLFNDWSLYRLLISNDQDIVAYFQDKSDAPAWVRSLRLYFIRLIDKEPNLEKWLSQYNNLTGKSLVQDIMLDSIFFATNSLSILEKLWNDFLLKHSDVFRRLLKRFLFIATTPDPLYMLLFKNDKSFSESELATFKRIPIYIYWPPVLKFLHRHFDEVVKMSLFEIAQISDLWLRNSGAKTIMRKEAAELGIYAAEVMLAEKISPHPLLGGEELTELTYKAGLAAINEFPERVQNFALIAAGKKKPEGKVQEAIDAIDKEYKKLMSKTVQKRKKINKKDLPPDLYALSIFSRTKKSKPWKEGPYRHPVSEFSKICLTTDALQPVIHSEPSVAIKIIMCLLIEVKKEKTFLHDYEVRFENNGMRKLYEWFPPFYTNGQFYFFLNNNFEEGIRLIIKLVEFATNRWRDNAAPAGYKNCGVNLEINGKRKKFYGDVQVFYWHRRNSHVPFSVASALMALEKWFYDNGDDASKIKKAVKIITGTSTSLALIGVLSSFGKKYYKYFEDILFHIIIVPEFLYWDLHFVLQGEGNQMIGWSYKKGEFLIKLAQEWNSMLHRKTELNTYFSSLILDSNVFQKKLPYLKKSFIRKLYNIKSGGATRFSNYLERLIAECDLSNWIPIETGEKNQIAYDLKLPSHLIEDTKEEKQQADDNLLLLTFPFKCKQILDGEITLNESEVKAFYDNIEKFKSQVKTNIDESVISIADSICGIIAVLYTFHRKWLKENPDAEQQCLNYVVDLFKNPAKTDEYLTEVSIFDAHWYSFCAYSVPIIWSENPDSKKIREIISKLASVPHYITTNILFENTWKVRKKLDNNFYQLIHFVLNLSYLKGNYYRLRDGTFTEELKIESEKFNDNRISPEIPPLLELGKQFTHIKSSAIHHKEQIVHLDLSMVKNVFSFLNNIDISIDEEKGLLFRIVDNVTDYTLASIDEETDKDYSYPNDFEYWVFNLVSYVILRNNEESLSRKYGTLIISLDSAAHHYIVAFLHSFFANGLNETFINVSFKKTWYEILDYCFSSENLKYSTGKSSYDLDDIWCAVMGIDDQAYTRWSEKHSEFLITSYQYFDKWCKNQLKRSKCMFRCLKFLLNLPADKFSFDILMIVRENIRTIQDNYRDIRHIDSELSSVLHHLWDKNKELIKSNSVLYNCFNDLVLYLNEKQHISAQELIERMSAD